MNEIMIANQLLEEIKKEEILERETVGMPIGQLATLGAGVSSLMPALQSVTQTTTINTQGLYRLANANVGDTLKLAKNGNFWGAFKTADGASKFAQLQEAGSLSATSTIKMPFNPATMMMAVTLFSIEQQLGEIAETQRQILSFLEIDKESEIEADVETLTSMITKYKFNWDNENFIKSNHKLVLDIQRTSRKNMLSYQKMVNEVLNAKQRLVSEVMVNATLKDLLKKFRFYRLSLYNFSMATLIEIMLSGDFKEENVLCLKDEIEKCSITYRETYGQCSELLEKMSQSSLETNVLKGVGAASRTVGNLIGSIPVIKNGQVDEFFQNGGRQLKENAVGIERKVIEEFAAISNPSTKIFLDKMETMIQIYNHTTEICFDDKNIYLIAE